MQARSTNAFLVSLTLHAFIVGMIFLTTVYVAQKDKDAPHIIELVAGPPVAPEALEAPALGNTTAKIKLEIPKVELPQEEPEPPQPEAPADPTPPPPEKKPAKPEPVKAEPVKPTPKPTKEAPKPSTSFTKDFKQKAKMSYQDYLKKHPTPKPAKTTTQTRTPSAASRIDTKGIVDGVRGGSTNNTKGGGGGKALTREEQSLYDTYFSFLLSALKEAHEPPPGVSDALKATVAFELTASGTVLNPRIVKSSGNREFDQSVLAAFRRMRSIGPTPDGKAGTFNIIFTLHDE